MRPLQALKRVSAARVGPLLAPFQLPGVVFLAFYATIPRCVRKPKFCLRPNLPRAQGSGLEGSANKPLPLDTTCSYMLTKSRGGADVDVSTCFERPSRRAHCSCRLPCSTVRILEVVFSTLDTLRNSHLFAFICQHVISLSPSSDSPSLAQSRSSVRSSSPSQHVTRPCSNPFAFSLVHRARHKRNRGT